MRPQAILAARAFTPYEEIANPVILIEGSRIAAIGPREKVKIPSDALRYEAHNLTVVPGFVDVHIHGAGGHDIMEGTAEALNSTTEAVAQHGTTSIVATTVSADPNETCRTAAGIARWMAGQAGATSGTARAEVLGLHFEGPFINPARRGVHSLEWIVPPSTALLRAFLSTAAGAARILTLAPELPVADEVISEAVDAGLIVSLGHTDASYEESMAAIERGARHAAHVFNAMRPLQHRETGVVGAVLTSPKVTAELIADGVHVDPPAMKLVLAAKGRDGVILVSDGTAATGMPDGTYQLGCIEVSVKGGVCRNAEGKLAGSTLTLDRALRNVVALGTKLPDALAMLTTNPARLLSVEGRKGRLAAGADADLVLMDSELQVRGVMSRGSGLARFAQIAQS